MGRTLSEKLPLLLQHYAIEDETDYFGLALALARDHVPGFSVTSREYKLSNGTSGAVEPKTKTGRTRSWTSERLSQLLDDVENIKREQKIAEDREALHFLARKKWKPGSNHRGGNKQWVETLESRLQEEKSNRRNADNLLTMLEKIRSELPN